MKRNSSCLNLVELGKEETILEDLCEQMNDMRAREPVLKKVKMHKESGQDSDHEVTDSEDDESIQVVNAAISTSHSFFKVLEGSEKEEECEDFGIFVLFDSDLEECGDE